MLEEIRVDALGRVDELVPLEAMTTFGAAWLGQSPKVVAAQRAADLFDLLRPIETDRPFYAPTLFRRR